MLDKQTHKFLGRKLVEAGLISEQQLMIALEDQKHYNLKIGEILADHQWVKQETADFFAREWEIIKNVCPRQPLGYYLQRAGLLSEQQINQILEEQEAKFRERFGKIAIHHNWVSRKTIRYFLESLNSHVCSDNCQANQANKLLMRPILFVNAPNITLLGSEILIIKKTA
jgi:hypothetical protein